MSLLTRWNQLGHPRLLVVGDIILDRYTWGNAERISPEAPVMILRADTKDVRLGGAASVATLARGLEADVSLVGVIGDDTNGRVVRRLLREAGIDDSLVIVDDNRPTTTKERFIGRVAGRHPHQILRVDDEVRTPVNAALQRELIDRVLHRLPEFQAVLISDYGKGLLQPWDLDPSAIGAEGVSPPVEAGDFVGVHASACSSSVDGVGPSMEVDGFGAAGVSPSAGPAPTPRSGPTLQHIVIRAAEDWGLPIIVDPARLSDYTEYRGTLILKPNRLEAELATGIGIVTPQDAIQAGDLLCERLGLQAAVITLDRDGMVLSRPGQPGEVFPTRTRSVYDITGAGDMSLAVLGLVLALPAPHLLCRPTYPLHMDVTAGLPDAIRLANVASGLEVERWGVTPISRDQVRAELLADDAPAGKILGDARLTTTVEQYRRDGKTIVFTNGCFDLLHVGHISLLEEASRLGDVLIVAINSDASVKKLKGTERPIIGQDDRARMLAALACVDHVVIYNDDTPHRLLEAIRPDVLVKGGTTGHIVGREIVEAYGGRIVRTQSVPGLSTTNLVQRMQFTAMSDSKNY